jgi:hypothetical protein
MQVRDWDLGDGGEGGNKDKRYLFFSLAAVEEGMQSSSKRSKVQATETPVQRIQGGRPEYNEPQTTMKLHAFKSSLVIVPCLLAHVFRPCMGLHKTTQARFYIFLILQKNLAMFFKLKFYFVHGNNLNLSAAEHGTNHLGTEKVCFLFYFNNFHSQNVKPCGRTTRFSALHCQDQKGRLKCLIWEGDGI